MEESEKEGKVEVTLLRPAELGEAKIKVLVKGYHHCFGNKNCSCDVWAGFNLKRLCALNPKYRGSL